MPFIIKSVWWDPLKIVRVPKGNIDNTFVRMMTTLIDKEGTFTYHENSL